jgi:hypothetical protein
VLTKLIAEMDQPEKEMCRKSAERLYAHVQHEGVRDAEIIHDVEDLRDVSD